MTARRRPFQNWRSMWTSCWTCPVTSSELQESRTCLLIVSNLLKTSSLRCWTKSEGCRSCPRLRRSDASGRPPLRAVLLTSCCPKPALLPPSPPISPASPSGLSFS